MKKIFLWLKNVFLFIFKEICSFFIKLILAIFVLAILFSAIVSYVSKENVTTIENDSYVLVRASTPLTEHIPIPDPFAFAEKPMTFFELLYALDSIRQDNRIKGVLLDADYISWNKGQIEEIGEKLKIMQSEGKEVIAFLHEADRNNYFLSSYAKDIVMPPVYAASSNITAYHYEEFYWKSLLDKLGIKVNLVPIGNYKSYLENYARGSMSPEFKENTKKLLDLSYDYVITKISENREISKEDFATKIESGEFMASSFHALFQNKLITQAKYPNQIYDEIGDEHIIHIQDYYQQVRLKQRPKQYIALLSLEGTIEDESLFLNEVYAIEHDDRVKGVVLRIDSPGGSALSADIMYHAVKKLGEKLPVYVSIGGIAASGGYYVAAAGEKIFAPPLAITGSIGVVSMIPNFSNLQEKASIHSQEITRGKYADIYSTAKPLSQENFERIRQGNLGVYDDFLSVVATNRNIEKEYLDKELAQGRVWLGLEAKQIKLIDEFGGLERAIYELDKDKNLGHLPIIQISKNNIFDSYLTKYRKFIQWTPLNLGKTSKEKNLWNKPLTYFPYEME